MHEIWLCYKCGKCVGTAGGDVFFSMMAQEHPEMILTMVQEKILTPITTKKNGTNRRNKTFGIIELEVKVDEHESHTLDRRGMYKSFVGISLGIVGSLIAFFQLSLMLNP